MSYGFCPHCAEPVTTRERRMNGNDTCKGGHVYPSRLTLGYRPPATTDVLREAGQLLAAVEDLFRHVKADVSPERLRDLAADVPILREMVNGPFLHRVRETRAMLERHLAAVAVGRVA